MWKQDQMILVGLVELVESLVSLEHNRELPLSLSIHLSLCVFCLHYTGDFILDWIVWNRGVPPGARFDPYGPPGVPGFEPNRFVRCIKTWHFAITVWTHGVDSDSLIIPAISWHLIAFFSLAEIRGDLGVVLILTWSILEVVQVLFRCVWKVSVSFSSTPLLSGFSVMVMEKDLKIVLDIRCKLSSCMRLLILWM